MSGMGAKGAAPSCVDGFQNAYKKGPPPLSMAVVVLVALVLQRPTSPQKNLPQVGTRASNN